ncbi:MAG: LysE family translocator, partial [Pseudorhizobium sp.]
MSIEFLFTSLVIVASPGAGVLYTLAAGLSRGAKASIFAAFACTLGIVPHIAAAVTGLAAVLHASALAFEIIKYLGVAYLLYMAWKTIRDRDALSVDEERAPRSVRQTVVDGILLN